MKKSLFTTLCVGIVLASILAPTFQMVQAEDATSSSQNEILVDKHETMKARVLDVLTQETRTIASTDVPAKFQTIRVEIISGSQEGKILDVENDYLQLEEGEVFYLRYMVDGASGQEYYTVDEPYRLPQLIILVALFVVAVFIFGGFQGLRGLLSLCGSFLLIIYVLLPGVLHGFPPLLVATGVSSLIIIVGSYITHGFNKTTTSAVIGMIITVIITGLLAYFSVHWMRLSGFSSDEMVYLNLNTHGSLDVVGLLLGGIMIGLLGVLYDSAIGQAISVEELLRIAPHVPKKKIYERAIRIGREHIGALVNTLAIAYVGAALPLLLLFYMAPSGDVGTTVNRELFATEIVRTMVGSIGLVLAVPITTLVCLWILTRKSKKMIDPKVLEQEERALEHAGHSHSH